MTLIIKFHLDHIPNCNCFATWKILNVQGFSAGPYNNLSSKFYRTWIINWHTFSFNRYTMHYTLLFF